MGAPGWPRWEPKGRTNFPAGVAAIHHPLSLRHLGFKSWSVAHCRAYFPRSTPQSNPIAKARTFLKPQTPGSWLKQSALARLVESFHPSSNSTDSRPVRVASPCLHDPFCDLCASSCGYYSIFSPILITIAISLRFFSIALALALAMALA